MGALTKADMAERLFEELGLNKRDLKRRGGKLPYSQMFLKIRSYQRLTSATFTQYRVISRTKALTISW